MKKYSLAVIVIILLFFSQTVKANNFILEPKEIDINLVAGDTISKRINISWDGEEPTLAFLYAEAIPDEKGLKISFTKNPILLYESKIKNVDMILETQSNLAPGNFTIEIILYTNPEKVVEKIIEKDGDCSDNSGIITTLNQLQNEIILLKSQINSGDSEDLENINSQLQELYNKIADLKISLLTIQNSETSNQKNSLFDEYWLQILAVIGAIFIILLIIIVYLVIVVRKMKKNVNKVKERVETFKKSERIKVKKIDEG